MVIGAVLIPGAKAPKLVSNDLVAQMKPGSVLVDIAVDQGGCFEDTRPTTHADPTYPVHNSIFYCVANMPGAVPNTSTYALTNATLPYAVALADKGWQQALRDDHSLALGLNTHAGALTYAPVGDAHELAVTAASTRYWPERHARNRRASSAPTSTISSVERGLARQHAGVVPARPASLRRVPRRQRESTTSPTVEPGDVASS